MHMLIDIVVVIAAVLAAGAAVTKIGAWLIARAHPPGGHFVAVPGAARQHVLEIGEGGDETAPAIVVVHGASANLGDMRLALAGRFSSGHRVIFIDRPGQGYSGCRTDGGATPADQAAVLREVLDRLGVRRALLVGHSLGGSVALAFALDFPERTAGLVLIAPATHPGAAQLKRRSKVLAGPFGAFFVRTLALPLGALLMWPGTRAAFLPQPVPRGYITRSAAMLVLRPRALLANWADVGCLDAFLAGQAPRYGALAVPAVVLAGDRDPLVPLEGHAAKLAAAAPEVKLLVEPGFGHMLHHAAAERVVAAVEYMIAAVKK